MEFPAVLGVFLIFLFHHFVTFLTFLVTFFAYPLFPPPFSGRVKKEKGMILDGPNRQSLAFSERGRLSQAIPQFQVERMLNE